jgi:hypothetical protein
LVLFKIKIGIIFVETINIANTLKTIFESINKLKFLKIKIMFSNKDYQINLLKEKKEKKINLIISNDIFDELYEIPETTFIFKLNINYMYNEYYLSKSRLTTKNFIIILYEHVKNKQFLSIIEFNKQRIKEILKKFQNKYEEKLIYYDNKNKNEFKTKSGFKVSFI